MKAKGRNSESTSSLLVTDVPSFGVADQVRSKSRKMSTALLSRLLRKSSLKSIPQPLRKASPVALHSSALLSQRSAHKVHVTKATPHSSHNRVMSEDVRRQSPVVTLISEHSHDDQPKTTLQMRLHDLLYNFSSQLALIYEPKIHSILPVKTQLRRHRDFAIRLQRQRFSSQTLKRAVFYAWKGLISA